MNATLATLGYAPTAHPDVISRPLDPGRDSDRGFRGGSLYCSCRNIAVGVVRHTPTGYRELYCANDWHKDLPAFVDRAAGHDAYWAGLRAQDDAYIAANPGTEHARDLAERWDAMVRQPRMPE